MRQQVIGGVDVDRTDATNDRAPPSPLNDLAEGSGDLNAPVPAPPVPRRNMIDVFRDHREINNFLEGAVDDSSRELCRTLMRGLVAEGSSLAQSFGINNQSNNDTGDSDENVSIAHSP